jgi:hypothetical protein
MGEDFAIDDEDDDEIDDDELFDDDEDIEIEEAETDGIEIDDIKKSIDRRIYAQLKAAKDIDKSIDLVNKARHIRKWLGKMPLGDETGKKWKYSGWDKKYGSSCFCVFIVPILLFGLLYSYPYLFMGRTDFGDQARGALGIVCIAIALCSIPFLFFKQVEVPAPLYIRTSDDVVSVRSHGKRVLRACDGMFRSTDHSFDLFVDGDWIKTILDLHPKSLEVERKHVYEKRVQKLRNRLDALLEVADKWGFVDKLDMSEAEIHEMLDIRLDELVKLSNKITENDKDKMKALEKLASEVFGQIEELGLVTVVNNVCTYCMAYIGKADKCKHCGATRRTITLS